MRISGPRNTFPKFGNRLKAADFIIFNIPVVYQDLWLCAGIYKKYISAEINLFKILKKSAMNYLPVSMLLNHLPKPGNGNNSGILQQGLLGRRQIYYHFIKYSYA
jgi:hypothetical protein